MTSPASHTPLSRHHKPGERFAHSPLPTSGVLPTCPDCGMLSALVLLVGAPGSGKTTWAKERFPDTHIVSLDQIRLTLTGDEADQSANPVAASWQNVIVRERMRRRLRTVVDATNARAAIRDDLTRSARYFGVPVVAVLFDADADVCMDHMQSRDRQVPRDIVEAIRRDIDGSLGHLATYTDVRLRVAADGSTSIEANAYPTWDSTPVVEMVTAWAATPEAS